METLQKKLEDFDNPSLSRPNKSLIRFPENLAEVNEREDSRRSGIYATNTGGKGRDIIGFDETGRPYY